MIKAALIDMDGTLYDSMPHHADAWMQMVEANGLKASRNDFFTYEGATGASMIDRIMQATYGRHATEQEKIELYRQKSAYFAAMPPVELMPGAQQMVALLQSRGIATVLVTGSGQATLLNRLEQDFPGAFPPHRRVTSASVSHGKPHPEPFLRGLELAGVSPHEAIAIDNAPLGTTSAHAAGVYTIGVVTGPIDRSMMERSGADIIYNSMPECAEMLSQLL